MSLIVFVCRFRIADTETLTVIGCYSVFSFYFYDFTTPFQNVVVFPNGIHLTQAGYQQLLIQLNANLPPYMILE
jgi:hypothetical protein